jgi:hypothetical protein
MVIPKASSIYSPKIIDLVTNRSGRYSTAIQLGWDLIFSPGGRFAAKAAPCAVAWPYALPDELLLRQVLHPSVVKHGWEIPEVSGGFRWEKVIFHVKLPVLSFCRVLEICFFSLQNVAQRDSWYSSIFDEGQVRSLLRECQSKFSQISLWTRAVVKHRLLSKRLGKHQYPLPIG